MRITRKVIEDRAENYRRTYGFVRHEGWSQVSEDLRPVPEGSSKLPRAVAYGAYMALCDLLDT